MLHSLVPKTGYSLVNAPPESAASSDQAHQVDYRKRRNLLCYSRQSYQLAVGQGLLLTQLQLRMPVFKEHAAR